MRVSRLILGVAGLLLAAALPVGAWSASGHSVVAALAYRQLDAPTRKRVQRVLEQHPAYAQWRPGIPQAGVAPDEYLMLRAAAWPDEVRGEGRYDRPAWHYINKVYSPDDPDATLPEASEDIVKALTLNKEAFIAEDATPTSRAVAVAWLLHLVGDIHQPLHAVTLVTEDFPKGDRGGNLFFIQPTNGARTLHAYWDGLLNTYRSPREADRFAGELAMRFPRGTLRELGPRNPADWANESHRAAVTYAYTAYPDPERPYVVHPLKPGLTPERGQPLPPGYAATAREQATRRAALAGYRLKDALWGLFYGQQ